MTPLLLHNDYDADFLFHQGGHFAALEKPEVLLQDVGDFIEQEWPKASKL